MLHQPGHVLQGVNSGDKSQVILTDQSIDGNPYPVRGGLLLPQGDPAQPGVHQVRLLRGSGEKAGRQHRVQGLLRPGHPQGDWMANIT